jgi:hypothetical protein
MMVPAVNRLDLSKEFIHIERDHDAHRRHEGSHEMPTAQPDLIQTTPGTPVTIAVLANDDGPGLRIVGIDGPAYGSTVLNADQTVTYTPGSGFQGTDSFGYTARDGANATVHGMVTVTVRPPNHAPVANSDQATALAGQQVVIPVLANDNDPDGDPLSLVAFETPAQGSLVIAGDQTIRYLAKAGQSGKDAFFYTISDGRGGLASAMVGVTVQPANQPPVANAGNVTTLVDTPLAINLLATASDPDGDQLSLVSFTLPSHGTLAVTSRTAVLYTPASGHAGADSFSYTVSDGHGGTVTGLVNVQVARTNSLPVAANDNAATVANQPVTINVLANDSDPDGDSPALASLTLPAHGTLTVNGGQTLTYTPATGYVGGDEFRYTITDGRGGNASGTVAIDVTAPTSPSTYVNGYLNRRTIIVPAASVMGGGAHASFPLLVQESGSWLKTIANGGKVQSGAGHDFRFELEDGTLLDHEVESHDAAAGQLTAWVRLPSLSSAADTRLHLYYGKSGLAASESDAAGVWRNHLAVYHLPSGQDRTGTGHDLVPVNVGTGTLIGQAGSFNGASSVLTAADSSWLDGLSAYSCQAWIKSATDSTDKGFITVGTINGADANVGLGIRYDADGHSGGGTKVITIEQALTGGRTRLESSVGLTTTDRQQVTLTWTKNGQAKLYTDGIYRTPSFITDATVMGPTAFGNGPLQIGAGPRDTSGGGWSGLIDEVRFLPTALSATWIATEHANQKDPQAFYGLGGENVYGDAGQAPVAMPLTVSTNQSTAVDIDALASAFDPDTGAVLTLDQVGTPASGTAAIVAGKLRYTPGSGFIGQDSFTYRVSDGTKTSTSKVTVTVVQVASADNDRPYCNKFYGCLMHSDTIGNTRFTKGRPVSVRFRAERSGQITSFRWNLRYNGISSQDKQETSYSLGDGGTVMVELRKNDPAGGAAKWWPDMTASGLLSKTSNNNGEAGTLVGRPTYPIWDLLTPVTVAAGQIYHLVFHQLEDNQAVSVNLFSTLNPIPVGSGLHSGPYYDDDYAHLWAQANYATNGWFIRPHHAAFLEFIYADGQVTGIGERYASTSAQKAVGGANMVRERFTVQDYTRSIAGVWTRIWYTSGTPSDLLVRLENNDGSPIEQVSIARTAISKTDLTTAPASWAYKAFSQPRTLAKGGSYRIRLSATSGSYWVNAVIDGTAVGYRSRNRWLGALAEFSTDGGSSWRGWTIDKFDPDTYRTDMHLAIGFPVVG